METLGKYVVSVAAAALICGIVPGLLSSPVLKEIAKMICGMALAVSVVMPILGYDFSKLQVLDPALSEYSTVQAMAGEEMRHSALADIIKAETEAYVLDKASELNAQLSVEIILSQDDPPIPMEVIIRGTAAPAAREELQDLLESQLGIANENKQWTG